MRENAITLSLTPEALKAIYIAFNGEVGEYQAQRLGLSNKQHKEMMSDILEALTDAGL